MYTNFIQSEHENIKVFKYADYMAIAGLFDLKTDSIFFCRYWENQRDGCELQQNICNLWLFIYWPKVDREGITV